MEKFNSSWLYSKLSSRRNLIVGIVLGLLVVTLVCGGAYFLVKGLNRSQAALPAELPPLPTATNTALVASLPLVTVPTVTPVVIQPTPVSQPVSSVWRFTKFNRKDFALFESVDTPGRIIKAKCQQPRLPPPPAGTLYRLDENGILTPVDGNTKVQRFAVK